MHITLRNILLTLIGAGALVSCSNDAWEDVPGPVFKFITEYWPSSQIQSYSNHGGVQTVWMKDGPVLMFDEQDEWIRLDGNGGVLPAMLIFDCVPSELYSYLSGLGATTGVYVLSRDETTYTVQLLDQTIDYDTTSGIHGVD